MFEMGKKGGPDKPVDLSMQRSDAAPARPEAVVRRGRAAAAAMP